MPDRRIPVIDLFAGPGGLGEGFASHPAFRIALSIEKEPTAHLTLELRAFFRQFDPGQAPADYYKHLRSELTRDELFRNHVEAAGRAKAEAWHAELGGTAPDEVHRCIHTALGGADPWVLIGGPPCQAYSLVGRSRNKGKEDYTLETDPRARLYEEYLRIIAKHSPTAFIMENVRGLLSSKLDGEHVFHRMTEDLQDPARVTGSKGSCRYNLHTLASDSLFGGHSPSDFLIRCERFGIPQARHRVIIVGIREGIDASRLGKLKPFAGPSVDDMIRDLPPLRSGLSKEGDSIDAWRDAVLELARPPLLAEVKSPEIRNVIERLREKPKLLAASRGAEFIEHEARVKFKQSWFVDKKLRGVCNHETRSHIRPDLHRYLFAAAFARVNDQTPHLGDFPQSLLPDHRNIAKGDAASSYFADRFRVQVASRVSTTVTSHIGKDGHYYIHPDPAQCRSLTVREAARLQTFPDNYFFCGPRTQQYGQVGNAVPPLLARQIAEALLPVLGWRLRVT